MKFRDRFHSLMLSWFGLGYAPIASGTFGTLGGVFLAAVFVWLAGVFQMPMLYGAACLGAALVLSLYGVSTGDWSEGFWGRKDPSQFVLDEVIGYLVAVAWIGPSDKPWLHLTVAFFVFRFFDIAKVWPANRLERLPGGLGIVVDDVAAGVWSWLALFVVHLVQPSWLLLPSL